MKTLSLPFSFLFSMLIMVGCDKDDGPTLPNEWACGDTIDYGGKTYGTVRIGSQCWLKENLDVGTMIRGSDTSKNNGIIEKYCYNDDTANCHKYGGLYQWNEAMQYYITAGTRGICPQSWHIPTLAEFQACTTSVHSDGNVLKAMGQDTVSTNTSGFSALLAGYRSLDGSFGALSDDTHFWGSTEHTWYTAECLVLYQNKSRTTLWNFNKEFGYSVRCLKK